MLQTKISIFFLIESEYQATSIAITTCEYLMGSCPFKHGRHITSALQASSVQCGYLKNLEESM